MVKIDIGFVGYNIYSKIIEMKVYIFEIKFYDRQGITDANERYH